MQVLKGPSRKYDPLYILTCSVCEAIIECNKSELFFKEALKAKEKDFYLLNCPCCDKATKFDYDFIDHLKINETECPCCKRLLT
jgi:hypothetical protein